MSIQPKAYSYERMSSGKQVRGDSLRRQLEMSEAFAAEHNLDLVISYQDLGVSGFRGANRERGEFAKFLADIKAGEVKPGSWFLVESLDRLSRDEVLEALEPFIKIVKAGVIIATFGDGQIYDRKNLNSMQLLMSLTIMTRSHEESAIKSYRQTQNWKRKRDDAPNRKMTGRCPAWLKLSPCKTKFERIPARVAIVRRIYTELANGIGRDKIARRLNQDGIKPWGHGREWHGGVVQKITDTRAVLGWFQPHRLEHFETYGVKKQRRVPVGDPMPDYYPPIIEEELWHRARKSSDARSIGPMNMGGRKGTILSNLFGNKLARCAECHSPMNYRDRGSRSVPALRCSGERNGSCTNTTRIRYKELERSILTWVKDLDLSDAEPQQVTQLEREIARKVIACDELRTKIAALLDIQEAGPSKATAARILEREAELESLGAQIEGYKRQLSTMKGAMSPTERLDALQALQDRMPEAEASELYALRSRVREALREIVDVILCRADGRVEVIVLGGFRAYRFDAALALDRAVDLGPLVSAGVIPLEAFGSYKSSGPGQIMPLPGTQDRLNKVRRLIPDHAGGS